MRLSRLEAACEAGQARSEAMCEGSILEPGATQGSVVAAVLVQHRGAVKGERWGVSTA
jgi:hypothetical protein